MPKKSKPVVADEAEVTEEDEVAAKRRRKKERQAAATALEPAEPAEEEQDAKKRKKQAKKAAAAAAAEAAAALQAAAEEEEVKSRRKRERNAAAAAVAAAVGAGDDEDVDDEEDKAAKKRRKKAEKAAAASAAGGAMAEPEAVAKGEPSTSASADSGELTVFVGGIPWSADEAILRKDFEDCGEVVDVNVPRKDGGLSRGIAFISFKTEAALQAALKFDGQEYGGRTLQIYRAESREKKGAGKGGKGNDDAPAANELEVFVRGLAWLPLEKEEKAIREKFKDCGKITRLNMPVDGHDRCKGFCWLTFKTFAAAERALEMNETSYDGRTLLVEKSGQHKGKGKGKDKGDKGKAVMSGLEIFVKNLGFETTEKSLKNKFSDCGEIERLKMPVVGEGKCMGFAWITFTSKDGLDAALALNDEDFGGRRLFVEQSGQHKGDGKGKSKGKSK